MPKEKQDNASVSRKSFLGRAALVLVGLIVILILIVLFVKPQPDPDKVHPAIRDLTLPLHQTGSAYYMDGGSVEIFLIEEDQSETVVWLPSEMSHPTITGHLMLGKYGSRTRIDETKYPDTRLAILRLIETYSDHTTQDGIAASRLSVNALEQIRTISRFFSGYYRRGIR